MNDHENASRNLLPASFQKRLLIRAKVRLWIACHCAVVMLFGLWWGMEYVILMQQKTTLAEKQAVSIPLQQLAQNNAQIMTKEKHLSEKMNRLQSISNANLHLQVLGVLSKSTNPLNQQVQIVSLTLDEIEVASQNRKPKRISRVSRVRQKPNQNKKAEMKMRLGIQGLAANDASIAQFVHQLESSPLFPVVKLKSANHVEMSSRSVRSYEIECVF